MSEDDFWRLFVQSQRHLERFASSLIRDESLREDVVAESCLSVLRVVRAGGGPSETTFISYMRVAVRNEALKVLANESRMIATDDIDSVVEAAQPVESPSDEESVASAQAVRRAFLRLPERSQTILFLVEVEGMRLAEVGKKLGMSERSVGSAVHRARDILRTRYLQEVVAYDLTCGEMRDDYLAAYARGKSTELRSRRVEEHCTGCARCRGLLNKMMSARVPVAALVGIAAVGGLTGGLLAPAAAGGAAVAAALTGAAKPLGHEALRAGLLKIGLPFVGIATAAGIVLVPLLQPQPVVPQTATSQVAADSSAISPAAVEVTVPPETEEAPEPSAEPAPEVEAAAPAPEIVATPSAPAVEPPAAVPAAVPGASWQPMPPEYSAGGTGVRLLLAVTYDGTTHSGNYEVVVTAPAGVVFTQTSAGCVVTGQVSVCTPTTNMAPLTAYNLQFVVDVPAGSPLPTAVIRTL